MLKLRAVKAKNHGYLFIAIIITFVITVMATAVYAYSSWHRLIKTRILLWTHRPIGYEFSRRTFGSKRSYRASLR